jgi:hypothetical protein
MQNGPPFLSVPLQLYQLQIRFETMHEYISQDIDRQTYTTEHNNLQDKLF